MEEADFKRLLEANAAETRAQFDVVMGQIQGLATGLGEVRQELRQEIAASAEGLRHEIAASAEGLGRELRQEIAASAAGLRQEMAKMREDIHDQFGTITDHLASKIELVAEGVAIVNEKLDREAADIRAEMRQGFADTHHLIRFARDLERRPR
jgi:DNA anti-recombination protein RmuC